jgi:hypothetical protein
MNLTLSLCDERIVYEAIFRHVEHLAEQNWGSSDSILAAKVAADCFPKLGYPVPHWITVLAQS